MTVRKRWTDSEDALIGRLYPDYEELLRQLPHRSYNGVKCRAWELGIVKRRRRWTGIEHKRLARLYAAGASRDVIQGHFSDVHWETLAKRANYVGATRTRKLSRNFAAPLMAIRDAAAQQSISLSELDRLIGVKAYWGKGNGCIAPRCVALAARALGGDVTIDWEPDT